MVKYTQSGDRFIIDDFQKAKTFASFLPAVAGTDGKPLWAFYANVGQSAWEASASLRATPQSRLLTRQTSPTKTLRLRVSGRSSKSMTNYVTPFLTSDPVEQQMNIGMADFSASSK
jgi:hypothetical protein